VITWMDAALKIIGLVTGIASFVLNEWRKS